MFENNECPGDIMEKNGNSTFSEQFISFLTPAPKAGVIVVASAVRAAAAAGTKLAGVPQTKPME